MHIVQRNTQVFSLYVKHLTTVCFEFDTMNALLLRLECGAEEQRKTSLVLWSIQSIRTLEAF